MGIKYGWHGCHSTFSFDFVPFDLHACVDAYFSSLRSVFVLSRIASRVG